MSNTTVVITAKGHPNIRGSHSKTFELTHDTDVTQTGTCIIGVECLYNEDALLSLRGTVKIHLQCGDAEDSILARMNPMFRRDDPLIIRRNNKPQPRTLCTSASKGASALNRDLIKALQQENATLTMKIEQVAANMPDEGVLYIIGTPIGNSGDISLRAIDTLQSVDVVLAEDTRTARTLLSEYGISAECISYHDHNERDRIPAVLQRLKNGERLALISEAGMPLISDPGYHIVSAAVEEGIDVFPVPGPDAVTTALSLSGISPADFRFIGFPPRKTGARKKLFGQFQEAVYAFVFFESPHRIVETLRDIQEVLGNRQIAVCKDLTKHTQHIYRGVPEEIAAEISTEEKPRGELAIVVEGTEEKEEVSSENTDMQGEALIKALLKEGCPTKMLSAAIMQTTGMKKRDAFNWVVSIKESLR